MSKIVPISFHAVFQFHYGTIKSEKEMNLAIYFNSTMVRLKGDLNVPTRPDTGNFNSTMVRLKEGSGWAWFLRNPISIPLWYD